MISVVVPTRDRADVLARCLDALAGQGTDEVIVVDDGSTDSTAETIGRYDWVHPVRESGRGRSAAKNAGLREARGDVVLFVDDDAIAQPGLVERHARHHQRLPEPHEALLGHVTWAPELDITRHMHWLEHGGPLFHYDRIEDPDDVSPRMLYTTNVSLKRDFLEPFDEELPIYEDTELAHRLSKRGLRLRYDPLALVHHLRVETPERTERRMEQVGAAAVLLWRKWPELAEPLPPIRRAGRVKAAVATALSRLGWHGLDERLWDQRAAAAFRRGYDSARGGG